MKYNPLLEPYKALVPFLAELLGESCEILLHDISQPKHSVIAIANGFHTGRKVGSPFTDLAIKIMEEKAYVKRDYITDAARTRILFRPRFLSSMKERSLGFCASTAIWTL